MSKLKCGFGKCLVKATAKCFCKKPFVLFCDEHLGNHLLNSPGDHDFKKLLDDPYLQTKNSVLLCMQNEIKILKDLKESIVEEIYFQIIKLENSLENYIENLDKEIFTIEKIIKEVIQTSESNNESSYLEYLKLPSYEAVAYFKENVLNLNLSYESIISEIYKNADLIKFSQIQQLLRQNKTLELELLKEREKMTQAIQENENLKQPYEEISKIEFEYLKHIESIEIEKEELKNVNNKLKKQLKTVGEVVFCKEDTTKCLIDGFANSNSKIICNLCHKIKPSVLSSIS